MSQHDPLYFYPKRYHRDYSRKTRTFGPYSALCKICRGEDCRCYTDTVFALARSNYRIYANIGLSPLQTRRMLVVLDTGASRNLVRASALPPGWEDLIRLGPTCDIRDANRRPIRVTGMIPLSVHVGTHLVQEDFLVCEKLAAPYILGTPFMDRNVRSIQPPERRIQLTDFSYEPIVRHKLSRGSKRIPRRQDVVDPPDLNIRLPRLSPKVRVTRSITLKPGYQTWVQVSAEVAGVHAVEPRGDLLRNHSVSATNGVVDIEPGLPFWLLVANFGATPYRLNKHATIARLSVSDFPLPPTKMTAGQLLGINYEETSDDTDYRQDVTSLTELALGAESRKFDDLRPPAQEAK
eukprot:IDg23515t1